MAGVDSNNNNMTINDNKQQNLISKPVVSPLSSAIFLSCLIVNIFSSPLVKEKPVSNHLFLCILENHGYFTLDL